jgi:hypothetical protein
VPKFTCILATHQVTGSSPTCLQHGCSVWRTPSAAVSVRQPYSRAVQYFPAISGPAYPWPPRCEERTGPRKHRLTANGQNRRCVATGAASRIGDNGEGPSTHEMEGPARPPSATLRAHAQRPTGRSAAEPDTRLKSRFPGSPCVRGAPRMVPVFGGERFLRLWPGLTQGVGGK